MITCSGLKTSNTQINSRSGKLVSLLIQTDGTNAATATVYNAVLGTLTLQNIVLVSKYNITSTNANQITLAYTPGAVAGSEVVTVTGNAISVQIATAASTATQVLAALNGSAAALLLVTPSITGTASTAQVTASAVRMTGADGDGSILVQAVVPGATRSNLLAPASDQGVDSSGGLYLVLSGTGASAIVYFIS